jgi:ribosome-binding factor A
VLSTALLRDVADPRVMGLVSITHIELTADLHDCKVHVSILSDIPAGTVMQGLNSAKPTIQRTLAKNLATRTVPRLHFVLDESLKRQSEVDQILKSVAGESHASGENSLYTPPQPSNSRKSDLSNEELKQPPIEEI